MSDSLPDFRGHRQRLRQRFAKTGLAGFGEYEVAELLLTLAIPRGDVKPQAKALIARFGNLRGILDAPLDELRMVQGVGDVTPVALRIIREAANLYLQQSAEQGDSLSGQEALSRFWRSKIGALRNEVFQVGYLDSGLRLLRDGVETLEEGPHRWVVEHMTRIVTIIVLLAATAGCTTTVRSTGTVPYPRDGIHLLCSRDGHLIQKTEWRHDALVSAWQYQRPQDFPREVIDAVNRGERDWPAQRWIQVVRRGTGRLTYLDEDGHDIGFADYHEGLYWRGAH